MKDLDLYSRIYERVNSQKLKNNANIFLKASWNTVIPFSSGSIFSTVYLKNKPPVFLKNYLITLSGFWVTAQEENNRRTPVAFSGFTSPPSSPAAPPACPLSFQRHCTLALKLPAVSSPSAFFPLEPSPEVPSLFCTSTSCSQLSLRHFLLYEAFFPIQELLVFT